MTWPELGNPASSVHVCAAVCSCVTYVTVTQQGDMQTNGLLNSRLNSRDSIN